MSARSARSAAASGIQRILNDGAYSNVLTARTEVEPPSDHGFYQRLVYTVLRHLPGIDRTIERYADRSLERIDAPVLAVLRVGVAELRHLGTEPHAAVNEAVEALAGRAARARGFVNAVLRSVAADVGEPGGRSDIEDAYPGPVLDRLLSDLGDAAGRSFLEASNRSAPMGLRFRPGAPESGSRYADAGDDIDELMRSAHVDIIDPASTAVADAVGAAPGMRIVDLAAAPGGKTRALADGAGSNSLVVGMDVHAGRLRRAVERSRDLPVIRWVRGDATAIPFVGARFDRVLLDAPCTGLGTLRRRPEIRHRYRVGASERYGRLQRRMLEQAIGLLAPGGRLVYSVCTPTSAETVEVVAGLGFGPPEGIDGPRHGDGVLLAPDTTGTDGMFIAVRDG